MGRGASRYLLLHAVGILLLVSSCTDATGASPSARVSARSAIAVPCPPVGAACPGESTTLAGAGATFPAVLYKKWIEAYRAATDVRIDYNAVGSAAGIKSITERSVDFGASDAPMTDKQLADAKLPLLHVPMVIGAVVLIYNVPGVSAQLRFTPEVIAGIYLGSIARWNDARLMDANPGVTFPDAPILAVHRTDGSGTTYTFTDYLSKVDTGWRDRVGFSTSVQWPSGDGGNGNAGVAAMVKDRPNSIGYVELIYALQNALAYGTVRNASGVFVQPTLDSTTTAAQGAVLDADLRSSITNPSGASAYPIATFTWALVYERTSDAAKGIALARYLWWAVHEGQAFAKDLGYAPLPPEVVMKAEAQIGRLVIVGPGAQ